MEKLKYAMHRTQGAEPGRGHLLFYPGIGVQLFAELGQKRSAHWEPFGVRCRWGVSTISPKRLLADLQTRDLRSRSQVDLP